MKLKTKQQQQKSIELLLLLLNDKDVDVDDEWMNYMNDISLKQNKTKTKEFSFVSIILLWVCVWIKQWENRSGMCV